MHANASLFPNRRRSQRGQTLIVAIAILFVLLFIGGVFIAQVGRNLTTSGRSRQIQQATELANAGITYCREQLVSSEEGADWRPDPSTPITSTLDPQGLRDPDYFWLSKGFHRISQRAGRALVRVVYDPDPANPNGQYLKIESIGRPGELNPDDPTEFALGSTSRLRKEMIAFVQIGLIDFGRFVTKRTSNGGETVWGVPTMGVPLTLVMGEPELGNAPSGLSNGNLLFGYPIHVNGDLRLVGAVRAYLSPRGVARELQFEHWEVTGDIKTEATNDVNGDGTIDANDLQQHVGGAINVNPDINPNTTQTAIFPTGGQFSTRGGLIRDGSAGTDAFGYIRYTPTRGAPMLDTKIGGGTESRFRALTAGSGVVGGIGNSRFNTGFGGYGTGVYINNPEDRQEESSEVPNSLSLRAEWLNPNLQTANSGWKNRPFYSPPGTQIELLGNRIRLTRNDNRAFTQPNGAAMQGGKVLEIPLSDWERQNYRLLDGTAFPLPTFPHDGDEPNAQNPFGDKTSYGVNVVIFAEGNVRVKGFYGGITNPSDGSESNAVSKLGRVHLTIVSGGTAYIDGNVVKTDGFINGSNVNLERGSTCAIMARDYICVNTTQFMAPANQTQSWNRVAPELDTFYFSVGVTGLSYDMASSFGIDPANYNTPSYLFLRHAAQNSNASISLINLLINPAFANNPTDPFYLFNDPGLGAGGYPHVRALGAKYNGTAFVGDPTSIAMTFEQRAYPLYGGTGTGNYQLSRLPGLDNIFRFRTDTTSSAELSGAFQNIGTGGTSEYLLGGAFVAPLDIRIEAMLYAQDRSFFIIPGYPMNPDGNDTRENVATRDERKFTPFDTPQEQDWKRHYPFYNEPADIRITIDGAISENYSASLADQTAWMTRWGWIPGNFGSSTQQVPGIHLTVKDPASINPTQPAAADYRTPQEAAATTAFPAGITRGLRYLYDPSLAMPYFNSRDAGLLGDGSRTARQTRALRAKIVQINGAPVRQILPPIPRLPVCPDLVYMGDSDRRLGTD